MIKYDYWFRGDLVFVRNSHWIVSFQFFLRVSDVSTETIDGCCIYVDGVLAGIQGRGLDVEYIALIPCVYLLVKLSFSTSFWE